MQTETVTIGDAKLTFTNAALYTINRRILADSWASGADDKVRHDQGERDIYELIAAHCLKTDGTDWTPPAVTDSAKKIEANYRQFMTTFSLRQINDIAAVVLRFLGAQTDELDQPDETLTEAQAENPT